MRVFEVNYERVYNMGNYESKRLGMKAQVESEGVEVAAQELMSLVESTLTGEVKRPVNTPATKQEITDDTSKKDSKEKSDKEDSEEKSSKKVTKKSSKKVNKKSDSEEKSSEKGSEEKSSEKTTKPKKVKGVVYNRELLPYKKVLGAWLDANIKEWKKDRAADCSALSKKLGDQIVFDEEGNTPDAFYKFCSEFLNVNN